jgi:toxin ParE1/3/4
VSVRYTRDALSDIDQILSYLNERSPAAAVSVADAIGTVVARLEHFPESAPETEIPGLRAALTQRYPYIVFYRLRGSDIEVVYVRHAARRRPWEGE